MCGSANAMAAIKACEVIACRLGHTMSAAPSGHTTCLLLYIKVVNLCAYIANKGRCIDGCLMDLIKDAGLKSL